MKFCLKKAKRILQLGAGLPRKRYYTHKKTLPILNVYIIQYNYGNYTIYLYCIENNMDGRGMAGSAPFLKNDIVSLYVCSLNYLL
jgi:hypothetical protein